MECQKAADPSRDEVNLNHYGDAASNEAHSPLGLLLKNGPVDIPILSLVASLDEPGIIKSWADFKTEYRKLGGQYNEIIMQDHNHISPIMLIALNRYRNRRKQMRKRCRRLDSETWL